MMERQVYTLRSLEKIVGDLEMRYGMSSSEFYERYLRDEELPGLTGFTRHSWASFYRELCESGGEFTAGARRVLELA